MTVARMRGGRTMPKRNGHPSRALAALVAAVGFALGGARLASATPLFEIPVATVGPFARAMATADLNGDGRVDLVVLDNQGAAVLLGRGDGSFAPQIRLADLGGYGLAAGDLDGDGKADLVVAGSSLGLSVRRGNGDGTFAPGVAVETPCAVGGSLLLTDL